MYEFPFAFTGAEKQPLLPPAGSFHPPWTPLWMSYANRAVKERGGDADASIHLHEWISNHPAFEDVVSREFWMPLSPCVRGSDPESDFWNEIGTTMRDDVKASNFPAIESSVLFFFTLFFCRHFLSLAGHSYLVMAFLQSLSTLWSAMHSENLTKRSLHFTS